MKKLKHFLTPVAAILLALVVTACGAAGSTTGNGGSANGDTANGGTTEGDASMSSDSGELVIGVSSAISTLDVNQEAGIMNYYIAALVNEGLVGIDNDGNPIPALAESWETEDYATWTFHIREDAVFSDGTPVTVDDIIWSIERAQDATRSPGVVHYFPDYIQSVTKVDESTIQVVNDGAHPSFIWSISNVGGLFVTSQAWGEAATSIGSPQDLLMGSGPYAVTSFEPGSSVTLEAQEHWWGGAAEVPSIRFDFIADDATRLLAFTQGSIDFALNIPVAQGDQWQAVSGATVEYFSDRSYYGLTLDVTVENFDNEHVRKAVAYAVNASGIVDSILGGHATAATAITPPEQFASAIDVSTAQSLLAGVTHYEYNLDSARQEFEQSGVEPFSTTIFYPDSFPQVGQASLVIAQSLGQIGIDVTVTEIPLEQWLTEIGNSGQGINWMIYNATTAEPQEIASWLLSGTGPGSNPANFEDDQIAGLIADIFTKPAADGIQELVQAHDLAQAAAYYVPVWWGQSAIAYGSRIAVTNFNSYTMLSQNWAQNFSFN